VRKLITYHRNEESCLGCVRAEGIGIQFNNPGAKDRPDEELGFATLIVLACDGGHDIRCYSFPPMIDARSVKWQAMVLKVGWGEQIAQTVPGAARKPAQNKVLSCLYDLDRECSASVCSNRSIETWIRFFILISAPAGYGKPPNE
jgi:hypothetical protein